MENCERPLKEPDKDKRGRLLQAHIYEHCFFMVWPVMSGFDLWHVLFCTLSFRADGDHSANCGCK